MKAFDVMVNGRPLHIEGSVATIRGFTRKSAKHMAKARYGDGATVVPAGTSTIMADMIAAAALQRETARIEAEATEDQARAAAQLRRETAAIAEMHRCPDQVRSPRTIRSTRYTRAHRYQEQEVCAT